MARSASPEEYSCGNMQAVGITAVEGCRPWKFTCREDHAVRTASVGWRNPWGVQLRGGASRRECSCGEAEALGIAAVIPPTQTSNRAL